VSAAWGVRRILRVLGRIATTLHSDAYAFDVASATWGESRFANRTPLLGSSTVDVILKRFDSPDEVRHFTHGRFELVTIDRLTIGRAIYQPGWRWSVDVGPSVGARRCELEHVGLVLEGRATAAFDDGRVWELTPGTLFHIPPVAHDSWVLGEEPYVSLHFVGAGHYAK
jgi:hypothetical protein